VISAFSIFSWLTPYKNGFILTSRPDLGAEIAADLPLDGWTYDNRRKHGMEGAIIAHALGNNGVHRLIRMAGLRRPAVQGLRALASSDSKQLIRPVGEYRGFQFADISFLFFSAVLPDLFPHWA
jgi:hypothetical protein